MNDRFMKQIERLEPMLRSLQAMSPVTATTLPREMPSRGVYLLSESPRHLYTGRSNNIRRRLSDHSRPKASPGSAAFAFRLARESTGRMKASYKPQGSRANLMTDPKFATAFYRAKERVRRMDLRFVEAKDPLTQCLLEIYVAVALETPYNDFDNH